MITLLCENLLLTLTAVSFFSFVFGWRTALSHSGTKSLEEQATATTLLSLLSPPALREIDDLILLGQKISAIKRPRSETNLDLRIAKLTVDRRTMELKGFAAH